MRLQKVRGFFPLLWHIVFLCIYVSLLFYPLIYWWTLQLFPGLGHCKQCCCEIGVRIFFGSSVLGFWGYIPSSPITRSKWSSIFNFLGDSILLSAMAAPVFIPTNSVQGFPFLHILASTCQLFTYWWELFWQVWDDISVWFWRASPWWLLMLSIFYMPICHPYFLFKAVSM